MTTPLLIVISIVLIIVGFILALLVTPLLGLDKSPKADPAQEENSNVPTGQTQPLTAERILRVAHDPLDNRIIVEIDGKVYTSVDELSQEQRRFLGLTSNELVTWLSRSVLEPERPTPVAQPPSPPIQIEQPPIEITPAASERNLVNSFLKSLQPGAAKTPPQMKSLAAQVDEVLQEKLPLSGLSHHSIHLVDLPNYGMSVQVDREQYPGIDAVPDEDIRNLIREAVDEWKKRSSLDNRG